MCQGEVESSKKKQSAISWFVVPRLITVQSLAAAQQTVHFFIILDWKQMNEDDPDTWNNVNIPYIWKSKIYFDDPMSVCVACQCNN